jgi:hypothetical protein
MGKVKRVRYQLEQLYEDQDPDLVLDTVVHVLHWLDPENKAHTHTFALRENHENGVQEHELILSWNIDKLAAHDARLLSDLDRCRARKTLMGEDHVKYAAYGLALVAISHLLHRRVLGLSLYRAPDLLLDDTPDARRGVEVAGRTSKGHAAFAQTLDGVSGEPGKRAKIRARVDVVEAYISLWCCEPRVSHWEQVKP